MKFDWLTREWGLKGIALILAVGLWYYAIGEEGVDVTRSIPLEIKVSNPQVRLLKTSTHYLKVTLSAPRGQLSNLASEEIRAVHEMGMDIKSAGDYSFRVEPRDIVLPNAYIRVTNIDPDLVRVTLDELIVKKVEIKPAFLGDPAIGYKMRTEEIQINPNAILIEGPKTELETLDFVLTEKIDLVGRSRSFRRTVEAALPSNVKALSEYLIDVYIPLREDFEEKTLENVPVKVLKSSGTGLRMTVEPPVVSFVLKGSRRRLEALNPEEILTYVDMTKLSEGKHEVQVMSVLPEDVSVKNPEAMKVTVTVSKI